MKSQTSNFTIIENTIQRIDNNVEKIQQIDSSLINQIRDHSKDNQANIIDILHHIKAFPRIPEKPYSGILKYCNSIDRLKLTCGAGSIVRVLENTLLSSGFYRLYNYNKTEH